MNMVLISQDVVQKALVVLDSYNAAEFKAGEDVMTALREALARQPAHEPVADVNVRPSKHGGKGIASVFDHNLPTGSWLLYTAPPAPQPLTDEQIEDICWTEVDQRLRSFARAIEAAHNIGTNK